MTTKEFIKRVEGLGFELEEHCGKLNVFGISPNGKKVVIARVEINKIMELSTNTMLWGVCGTWELFDLMVEYAETPVEERKEPEKYYLRAEGYGDEHGNYLNMRGGKVFFSDSPQTDRYQTQFTEYEIAQMPKWCQALEQVEVEE